MNTARAALSGYDVLTDTNLDHFSLYADIDNILIKRFLKGTDTIPVAGGGGFTTKTYAHNLGYIPFFVVFADIHNDGKYRILNNQYGAFTVPDAISGVDTSNLSITNFQAQTVPVAYDIFYDDMSQTGNPSISESLNVFKVARPNESVFSTNPNDFIMHSDLNNFKILGSGVTTGLSVEANGIISSTDITHGVNIDAPVKYFCFIKYPDGKVVLTGLAGAFSYDQTKGSISSFATTTKIGLYNFGASAVTVDVAWYIYGTGKTGTINNGGNIISVASNGNVLTETNPDNFNFHSNYPTLKYYESGSYDMGTITDSTEISINHDLGYIPFHIGFVNDLQAFFSSGTYAIIPYLTTFSSGSNYVYAFMYADSTKIYFKVVYGASAVGTSYHPIFYYKLFKNNLGI